MSDEPIRAHINTEVCGWYAELSPTRVDNPTTGQTRWIGEKMRVWESPAHPSPEGVSSR